MKTMHPHPSKGNGLMRLLLASVLCIFPLSTAAASQSVTSKHHAALQAIAEHLNRNTVDKATPVLQSAGFDPATVNGWPVMPTLRKLETAYLAAEAENPGRGGSQLLAIMSQHLAQDYHVAELHPELQPYLNIQVPQQIEFATPVMKRPPPKVARSILALTDYLSGNAMGGSLGIIRDYLQLPPDQAAEILRTSATDSDAIIRAINYVPESERKPRLEALVSDLDRTYDAARHDTNLDAFRPYKHRDTPQPVVGPEHGPREGPPTSSGPDGPKPAPSPHSGAPGSPSAGSERFPTVMQVQPQEAVSRYKTYEERVYWEPPAERFPVPSPPVQRAFQGSFKAVLAGSGGFGGVVFGSSVDAIGIGKPLTVQWIPSMNDSPSADAWGRIIILFRLARNGHSALISRSYGPVRLEDAYAAYKMIFAPDDGMPKWFEGRAIGLIGLADPTESFDCTQNEIVNEGVHWRVIMHPALTNLKLGWSAMMVDSLPIAREKFESQLAANADLQQQQRIHNWLSSTPGTWKFYDAPVEIKAAGGRLVLVPSDDPSPRDRHSYLRVKAFDSDLGLEEDFYPDSSSFEKDFVQLLPAILEASEDYARLNDFAAVLALFRWAAKNQATFAGSIPPPSAYPTASSLIITKQDQFLATEEFTSGQFRSELRRKVEQCLQSVTAEFPIQAQAVLKGQQDLVAKAADELVPAAETTDKIKDQYDRLEYLVNLAITQPANRQKLVAYSHGHKLDANTLDEEKWLEFIRDVRQDLSTPAEQVQQAIYDYERSISSQKRKANEILEQLMDNEKLTEQLWAFVDGPAKQQYDKVYQEYQAQTKTAREVSDRLDELTSTLDDRRLAVGRQCASKWTLADRKHFNELANAPWRDDELDQLLALRCKGWKEELGQRRSEIVKQAKLTSEAEMQLDDAARAADRLDDSTFRKLKYWYALTDQLLAIYGSRRLD